MSGQQPPLTCDEFKAVLEKLGFSKRPKKSGTTHEDWVATIGGRFYKVTVDCPKAPFSPDLIGSMAAQAGVNRKKIYDIHFGRETIKPATRALAVVVKRFEARKQDATSSDEFWCVWDTLANAQAFSGSLTYLTEAEAIARAEELSASHP
jgi:hypothetical protein